MKKSIHALVACVALGLAVSACGSGQNAAQGNPATFSQNGEGGAPGGAPGGPGGSGKVAAVSGSTAQVQGQGGQVAVKWTSRTSFTRQISVTAKDLKVGDCVVAMPASPSSDDTSPIAAASVRISTPVNGSCTGCFRAGQGGGPGGGPGGGAGGGGRGGGRGGGLGGAQGDGPQTGQGNPPSSAPSGAPRRGGFGAFGKVTAINGTGFSVESARPGSDDTSSVAVTTSGDTKWTSSAKATSKDVKVGSCVASFGKADSTGAITAASIALSQPVNGQCTATFAGFGRGRPGGSDQEGGSQNS
jgi:hypothetical protein